MQKLNIQTSLGMINKAAKMQAEAEISSRRNYSINQLI